MLKIKKELKKGFTLVELITIITIIAILSTVIIVSTISVLRKKEIESAKSTTKQYLNAIITTLQKNEIYLLKDDIVKKGVENYFGLSDASLISEIKIILTQDDKINIIVKSNKKEKNKEILAETNIDNHFKGTVELPILITVKNGKYKII